MTLLDGYEAKLTPQSSDKDYGVEDMRCFKHELRTSINHILGYSAMLAESSLETGDSILHVAMTTVESLGLQLAKIVEKGFAGINGRIGAVEITATSIEMLPLVEAIERKLDKSTYPLLDPDDENDMRKITAAVERLRASLTLL